MPDNQAQELPDTVSREAHQRAIDERNQARAENEALKATVLDMGYEDKARRHFAEKGVDDPDWAASIALPSMKSAKVETDAIGTYLDDTFARLYPTAAPPAGDDDAGAPTPDAIDPPSFARPSPGSDGKGPEKKVYTTDDPEVKSIIQANDTAKFAQMVANGEISLRGAPPVVPG